MPTLVPCPAPILRFTDNAGNPAVGGTVLTQVGGVNYPTYQDVNGNTALPNPIPLNSRGEVSTAAGASAQCFLEPGVAYTFTLYDAAGNQLWQANYVAGTEGQADLYGGVDTGIVNNYVLANVPNVPALQNGSLTYWIPSNSNTGASTLDVNGLGAAPIVNQNGAALIAGQISTGALAEVIYYNGNWVLLNPATVSGTFLATCPDITGNPTITLYYTVSNSVVTLDSGNFGLSGVSNSVTLGLTGIPAALMPPRNINGGLLDPQFVDNGAICCGQWELQTGAGDQLLFGKVTSLTVAPTEWTAAGNKAFPPFCISYPLK